MTERRPQDPPPDPRAAARDPAGEMPALANPSRPGVTRGGASRPHTALADLPAAPGLCASCAHLGLVGSRTSVFVRCGLSDVDPGFPRYPPLPVLSCTGYRPVPPGPPGEG